LCAFCVNTFTFFSPFFSRTTPQCLTSPPLPAIQWTMRLPPPQSPSQPRTPSPPLLSMPMSGGVVAAAPEAGPSGSPRGGNSGRDGGVDNAPGPGGSSSGSVGHRRRPLRSTGKTSSELPSRGGCASSGCRWRWRRRRRRGGSRVAGGRGRGRGAAATAAAAVVVARRDPRAWTREGWTTTPPSSRSSDNAGTAADDDAVVVVDVVVVSAATSPSAPWSISPFPPATAAAAFGRGARRPRARR